MTDLGWCRHLFDANISKNQMDYYPSEELRQADKLLQVIPKPYTLKPEPASPNPNPPTLIPKSTLIPKP